MLRGWKTYLFAAGIALATAARHLNWIDQNSYELLLALFGAGTAASLRSALKNGG